MKLKKNVKIALATITTLSILGGFIYTKLNTKEAYDYSDYYVEVSDNEESTKKEPKETPTKELSLALLQKTNSDVVGILKFDDCVIYEPIVQAPDNEYYVRKNIEKRYSAAGIPFISSEVNIDSTNVVIYGHSSTRSEIIFTPLMGYINKDYYIQHSSFRFITDSGIRTYKIFSIMNIDLNNLDDSLEFTQSEWRSGNDFTSFINNSISSSLYQTGVPANNTNKLMTLVTCDTRDNSKRIVILAKLVDSNE